MIRTNNLRSLQSQPRQFDLAIIGGGATGLASAVDAASRGHQVVLIEQDDFAKGTSSRSTKLVHGGVRYLKQGDVSMVLEALHERGLLSQNAPHLVHAMPFIIPSYHWWDGPFYGVGLKVYDTLAGRLGFSPSRWLTREETLVALPTIEPEGLKGGVVYYDGQFDDARLAISLARTAADHGAQLVNYCACTGFLKEDGLIQGLEVVDRLSDTSFTIRARSVVNATGVFVDALRQIDQPGQAKLVRPSQGVHLVLPRDFLPGDSAIMIPKTDDGRVLFAVPWHDCIILGTTDTAVAEPQLEPRALPEEVEFLLSHAARYLTRDPTPADVLSVFTGQRPLVSPPANAETSTASLSRDHWIETSSSGLITITGGKWTTCRKMAQDVVDQAQWTGGLTQRPCITPELRLHGATAEKNATVYGTDQAAIDALAEADPSLVKFLHPRLPYRRAEVVWHAREEMACTVEDVLARRTRALLLDARASIAAAPEVARLLAIELGHDPEWEQAQVTAYETLARGYLLCD